MNNNQDLYFKGQQKSEELICFFRHHWITLVKDYFYFIVFGVIIMFAIINHAVIQSILLKTPELKVFFIIGFGLGTIFIHRFFLKLFNHFVNVGIITDSRIIDHQKSLFFVDTMEAIDMANIQDLERKGEGLLPNLFGYGNLIIYLSASSSIKIFHEVPNAQFHFRCIARQKDIRQRMFREAAGLQRFMENNVAFVQQNHLQSENQLSRHLVNK